MSLGTYSGGCSISKTTTIDAKTVNCDHLQITGGTTTISRSKVNGRIDVDNEGVLVLTDSEVDANNADAAAIGYANVTVVRSHVHNAKDGVACYKSCTIRDSYIHVDSIPSGSARHMQAFLSNGGSDVVVTGSTLGCLAPETSNGGGCSAAAAIFGDFSGNHDYLFDGNLFLASTRQPYCVYGGYDRNKPYGTDVSGIVFRNNVFQRGTNDKCGYYGAATAFATSPAGNSWSNNVFDDGAGMGTPGL